MTRYASRETFRRDPRHDVLYACHVVRQRDLEVLARVGLDLSAGGVQVLTGAQVLTGEPVVVTFQAPGTDRWFTLRGTVARVLHGRRPNEWGRRLGIELEDVTAAERSNLVDASRALDARSARS